MTSGRFVIGADGGGTKTELVLVGHSGEIAGRTMGGCTNVQVIGPGAVKEEILVLVRSLLDSAGADEADVSMVVLGLAGAGRASDRKSVQEVFGDTAFADRLVIDSDAAVALSGAFPTGPGIILIAGTGAVCFGKSTDGRVIRSGGWGYLLGDEGSGYAIGRVAMIASLEDMDGRGPSTSLRDRLENRFEIKSIDLIIPAVYGGAIDRTAVADLAPLVFEEARKGDPVAREIVDDAGKELGRLVRAVARKMEREGSAVHIALIGGVFVEREILLEAIERSNIEGEDWIFVDPMFPPSVGAALMGLEKSGVKLDEALLRRLKEKAPEPS